MTHYQQIIIKINLKYGIEKKAIPTKFKQDICEIAQKLFPNWNTIEYEFKN